MPPPPRPFLLILLLTISLLSSSALADTPTPTLSTTQPWNLFDQGQPLQIRIDGPLANQGPLRLLALDAFGQKVFETPLQIPATLQKPFTLTLDPQGRHYLQLSLLSRHSTNPLSQITLGVIPKNLQPDDRFGFNAYPDQSPLATRLGAHWLRNHITWQQDAADKPLLADKINKTIQQTHSAGAEVFGVSNYSLPWAALYSKSDGRSSREFASPPKLEYWSNYITFAGQHIKNQVPVFEVWNEPNLDEFWRSNPDTLDQRILDYSTLLRTTTPLLKAQAPDIKVTTGSIANADSNALDFFSGLLSHGCRDSFDILNIHFYTDGPDPEAPADSPREKGPLIAYIQSFKSIMAKAGISRPIWLSEIGWTVYAPIWEYPRTQIDQSALLTRSHLLAFSQGVQVVIWYKLDGGQFGVTEPKLGPRPAAIAYAQLVHAIHDKTFSKDLAHHDNYAMLFNGKSESVIIAWSVGDHSWTLPPDLHPTQACNNLGEPLTLDYTKPLKLSHYPIYIICPNPH